MSHTPSPWIVTTENRGAIPEHFRPYSITDADGERVVARLPDGRGPTDRANAHLIAVAPLLLCMLERLLDEICMTEAGMSHVAMLTLEQSRKAITKAKGE